MTVGELRRELEQYPDDLVVPRTHPAWYGLEAGK